MKTEHHFYITKISQYLNDDNIKVAKEMGEEFLKLLQTELDTPKSGDRYEYTDYDSSKGKQIYVLQKLPDYDLWVLVRNARNAGFTPVHWAGPTSLEKCGIKRMRKL